jgi:hypothetical protein
MTSKRLGALLRSVPPATAAAPEPEAAQAAPPVTMTIAPTEAAAAPPRAPKPAPAPASEPEVPLQVLIPTHIRTELAIMSATKRQSLRALVLRAIRSLGVEVTDAEIEGKRGRRNS